MDTRDHGMWRVVRALRRLTTLLAVGALSGTVAGCGGGGLLGQEKRSPDEFAVYSRAPLSLPPGYNLRPPAPGGAEIDPYGPRSEARSALLGETAGGAGEAYGSGSAYAATSPYGSDADSMITIPGAAAGGDTASAGDFFGSAGAAREVTDGPAGIGNRYAAAAPAASPGAQAILARTGGAEADPAIRNLVNRETAILAEQDKSFVEKLIFWGEPTEYGTLVDPVEERRRIKENQALGRTITAGTTPTIERKQRALLEGIFD